MWIRMHWPPLPKNLWKSHKALVVWKKRQSNCTKLCKLVGIQVCELPTVMFEIYLTTVIDMAATMQRLQEYRTYNSQFCKRVFDFLSIMVVARVSKNCMILVSVLNSGHAIVVENASWRYLRSDEIASRPSSNSYSARRARSLPCTILWHSNLYARNG
jgi:hypothetical protein